MKRFSMQYESDQVVCNSNNHIWAMASSVKTAKSYIKKCRKEMAYCNPRNFRIYDHFDFSEDHARCLYQEN